MKKEKVLLWAKIIFLLLFAILHILMIQYHDAWRDEAQCWVLAKNLSIPELFPLLSSEGHPALWFLVLWVLTRTGLPYVYFPLFTIILICIAAAILLFKIEMPFAAQICVMISALFLYSNPIISRIYALLVLLVILIIYCWPKRHERPIVFGILTALLFQAHVIMAGMACGLLAVMMLQTIRNPKKWNQILGTGIALVSLLILPVEMYQRKNVTSEVDSSFDSILSRIKPGEMLNSLYNLCCSVWSKVPEIVTRSMYYGILVCILLGLLFFIFFMVKDRKSPVVDILIVAYSGFFGGFFIYAVVYQGTAMMHCTFLLSVILLLGVSLFEHIKSLFRYLPLAMMAVMLAFTAPASLERAKVDYQGSRTDSRNFQDFVEKNLPENSVIMILDHYSAPAAYAYLSDSRPDIEFLNMETGKTYKVHYWGKELPDISSEEEQKLLDQIEENRAVYYLDFTLDGSLPEWIDEKTEVYASEAGMDVFRLYLVRGAINH